MKILIVGNEDRYRKFMPGDIPIVRESELVFVDRGSNADVVLKAAADADFAAVDPMSPFRGEIIDGMPNLKCIHSEGVGFNGFDLAAADRRGIPVCNCKGCNAGAVAEQTILLMLALLRSARIGDITERNGGQIQMKERLMFEGITELGDCAVGLIGFGDIAKATALRLIPFGCRIFYYSRTRKSPEEEALYHATYLPLKDLLSTCDMISLHCPVTDETRGMVNTEFLSEMKQDAYLINTARGDIIDNDALRAALIAGTIKGAALDTISPEPTLADNPLIDLPPAAADRVIYSPHVAGITTSTFKRAHRAIWQAFQDVADGKTPVNIVNLKNK